jgi:hypothetical protein
MARLTWIASEVASATGFPNETHDIAEGHSPKRSEVMADAAHSIPPGDAVSSACWHGVHRNGQLPYGRQSGSYRCDDLGAHWA